MPAHKQTSVFFGVAFTVAGIFLQPAFADDAPTTTSRSNPEIEKRISLLIENMTLEEKLGQLTQQWGGESQDVNPGAKKQALDDILGVVRAGIAGSFLGAYGAEYTNRIQKVAIEESKHHIPMLIGNDVIHGFRTIFPVPLAEAATWDVGLVEQAERIAAVEARAAGTHWTFAPMVDVCRDARWGRIVETSGEDPFLSAKMAAARVRGFQGEGLNRNDAILACAKHYIAYGAAEGGRDYNTVDLSEYALRETHLPSFAASVDAGVGSIMSAFNEINGVPASANDMTLRGILRNELGFDGLVVSDWSSITEMINHGYAADPADAAAKSLAAGVDMDMCSFSYRDTLKKSVESGRVSIRLIDDSVARILRAKFVLGLFDNPYAEPSLEKRVTLSAEHRAFARKVAAKSMVLLKNDAGLLPLSDSIESIAVIGPLAKNQHDPLGTWSLNGRDEDVVSVIDGLKQRVGDKVLLQYAQGSDFLTGDDAMRNEAVAAAKDAKVALLFVGEAENMSGEAYCRATIDLPAPQLELVKAVHATGTPTIVVLMTGRPIVIPWISENIQAIVEAWHPGVECGNAVADVLFGDENPAARLPVTWPRHVGQIPLYYNHKMTGRPPAENNRYTSKYIDIPWTPQYPFGFGLSYTTFAYANLTIEGAASAPSNPIKVAVDVTNTGSRDGDEVVQLYIRDLVASRTRPVRELKGFKRLSIPKGETKQVTFELTRDHLSFYGVDMKRIVEPGRFQVFVGPNCTTGVEGEFEIK
ncbi:MAG: beta-glucosidase BglX [Phycisphaerales bacterium]|nr:beta-glucosidase BglX [Phycisphaerales bacterium]MCB9854730.1 beta-glucosidase BglX [Phycisphaerales bacterium]